MKRHETVQQLTKGPWFFIAVNEDNYAEGFDIMCGDHPALAARVGIAHSDPKIAALIASAPEMLQALEKISRFTGSTGGAEALVKEFQFIAREAIARAKNEMS